MKNQNTLVVNLPTTLAARHETLTVTIHYAGRLEPQAPERETIAAGAGARGQDDLPMMLMPEASFLYSNRSFWYPQAPVSDYATARIQHHRAVDDRVRGQRASCEPGFPGSLAGKDPIAESQAVHVRSASQPLRYLVARSLSRFARAETRHRSSYPTDTRRDGASTASR